MRKRTIPGVKLPKTQNGIKTFQELITAAEHVFAEKGFYEASVSDICKRAGTAVGTFYIYFEDKIAVYRYLIHDFKIRIRNALHESIENCTSRYERERCGIKSFIRFAWNNPHCYDIIWGSLSVDKKLFEEYYIEFARSYTAAIVRDAAELKQVNYLVLSYILMGITNFLGLKFLFEEDYSEKRLNETVDTVMNILTDGVFKKPETTN